MPAWILRIYSAPLVDSCAEAGKTRSFSARRPRRRSPSGSRKVDKTGTGSSIDADWEKIVGASGKTPKATETKWGPGEYVELPGGGTANVRPGSSGGPATIEINRAGMKPWKGRYD